MFERMRLDHQLRTRWAEGKNTRSRWNVIRDAYSAYLPDILIHGTDPYFLDWDFTPIEFLAWQDIRGRGLPLYPQFPALRYFIDFADPILQIGVELDGERFHEEQRDRRRDEELAAVGWRIFRIPGYKSLPSNQVPFEIEDEDERRQALSAWGERWSEGFFWALDRFYYRRSADDELLNIAHRILNSHRYVNFELEMRGDDE